MVNIDKTVGGIEEAVGALTGTKRLRRKGRVDQATASIKSAADNAAGVLTTDPGDHPGLEMRTGTRRQVGR